MSETDLDGTRDKDYWIAEYKTRLADANKTIHRIQRLHEEEIQLSGKRLKELQELKQANSDLAAAAICPDDCTPAAIRWQTAREIMKMIVKQRLCHDDEILLIMAIKEKFAVKI